MYRVSTGVSPGGFIPQSYLRSALITGDNTAKKRVMFTDESGELGEFAVPVTPPQHSTPIKKKPVGPVVTSHMSPTQHGASAMMSQVTAGLNTTSLAVSYGQATSLFQTTAQNGHMSSYEQHQQENSSPHSLTNYVKTLKEQQQVCDVSNNSDNDSLIQRQRRELQLLVAELRDRDKELNEMVAAHQSQLLAWEEDRQKLLTAQQKLTRYESDLTDSLKQQRKMVVYVKQLKTDQTSKQTLLDSVQQQVREVTHERADNSAKIQQLQHENENLKCSVRDMNSNTSTLEAHQDELLKVLRVKERDLEDASSHVTELSGRLKQLEQRCDECQKLTADCQQQANDWREKCSHLSHENMLLSGNLDSALNSSKEQGSELEHLRHRASELERELIEAVEREGMQSHLMESHKHKQERMDYELNTLRKLYDRQQRELALVQLQVDSSKELEAEHEHAIDHGPNNYLVYETGPAVVTGGGTVVRSKFEDMYQRYIGELDIPLSVNSSFISALEDDRNRQQTPDNTNQSMNESGLSPTSKLHRLLQESRAMVNNLQTATHNQDVTKTSTDELSHSTER